MEWENGNETNFEGATWNGRMGLRQILRVRHEWENGNETNIETGDESDNGT